MDNCHSAFSAKRRSNRDPLSLQKQCNDCSIHFEAARISATFTTREIYCDATSTSIDEFPVIRNEVPEIASLNESTPRDPGFDR